MIPLHENETIILEARKVWFVFAATAASSFAFALIPVVIFVVGDAIAQEIVRGSLLPFWIFLAALWWLVIWIWFFVALIDYYLDVLVITNERIVHFAQRGLFHREVAELRLSRIQDVTIKVAGILPSLLNYGDIRIATAGEVPEFIFNQVPHPEKVKQLIMDTFRAHLHEEHKPRPTLQP